MSSGQQSCDEAELAASDWEVATVLATGSRSGLDPSSASTECRSTSISRQSTALTNVSRGNTATLTPKNLIEYGVHQMAAQGELWQLQQQIQGGSSFDDRDDRGLTPLMWACEYGQYHMVRFLLESGADFNVAGLKGETSLMQACSAGNHQVATLLLERGCNVNAVDCNGNTALLFAISGSQPRCTELLLQHGADLMARNTRGHSPAELAIRMADKEVQHVIEVHVLNLLEPT
ncbi:hypothetical protein LSAT2_025956 [Lamellibrachia satsuma]|nr:hypothetical protein LSAT2_025956 [Lamellibrachia satsuma]